jgi:hypothetical protein
MLSSFDFALYLLEIEKKVKGFAASSTLATIEVVPSMVSKHDLGAEYWKRDGMGYNTKEEIDEPRPALIDSVGKPIVVIKRESEVKAMDYLKVEETQAKPLTPRSLKDVRRGVKRRLTTQSSQQEPAPTEPASMPLKDNTDFAYQDQN